MTQETVTETEERLPRRRDDGWWRVGIGALLVAIGIDILLEQITGYDINFVTLAVGLVLLAIWWKGSTHRSHGFLIGGSIVSGVGLGQLLSDLTRLDGMFQLGLAAGFAFLASRSHRAQWAWWPAAILGAIGALVLASDIGPWFLIDRGIASIAAPVVAIALGVILIMRPNIPKTMFRTLVIVLIVVGVVMVSALPDRSMFNGFRSFGGNDGFNDVRIELPLLDGRTLVVKNQQGSVELHQGVLGATARLRGFGPTGKNSIGFARSMFRVRETETKVVLEPTGRVARKGYDLRLFAPPDSDVRVSTGGGDVSIANFKSLEVDTGSGDVSGQLPQPYENVSIQTEAGDIGLTIWGDPTIHASTGSGDLEVNNQDLNSFEREGAGGTVNLQAGSGDIQLKVPSLRGIER